MGSGFASCSLTLSALLVLQCVYGSSARMITRGQWNDAEKELYDSGDNHLKIYGKQHNEYDHNKMHENHPSSHLDPSLNVFFTVRDLYVGNKMPIYFAIKDPSTSPHLLPRQEIDSIPFSSSKLEYLLSLFSFPKDCPQAKAMEHTLKLCEMKPKGGEIKFCATSLESMLDSTRGVFGLGTKFKLITTFTRPSDNTTLLQHYTILEVPREIAAPKMVACHTMPYPYAVFYCHGSQKSENKVFKISLGGENGDRVEAVAVCHMDSSKWDKDHVAFTVLRIRPGSAPVCHFFPADNFVWVPYHQLL